MRRRALIPASVMLALLVLLAWWLWPSPPEPPEHTASTPTASNADEAPEARTAPRPFPLSPPRPARGEWDTAVVGDAVDPDDPDAGMVVVHVVDDRGSPWSGMVHVASEDCRLRRATRSGVVRFRTSAERCTFEARLRDGVLARRTDSATAEVEAGEAVEVVLTMPSTRAAGVGVGLARSGDGIRVATVIPGSPAEAAGLESGDLLVAVDGIDLTKRGMEDVVRTLVGAEGSSVAITVGYDSDTGQVEERLVLTRRVIELE